MDTKNEGVRAAFNEAYASLNAAQKEAVDTIEGPVMVVAGPGTGKTQILTLRIANILLQTQMDPQNILALTFTDAGAKAMRERLHRYIGAEAYRVSIYTFHGFAKRLISDYPDAYQRVIGGRPAGDLDRIAIIETILEDAQFTLLRPLGNPAYYVQPILSILSSLKKEYITPDRFATLIEQQKTTLLTIEQYHTKGAHKGKERGEYTKALKSIQKNQELLLVYRHYEQQLADRRLYDFEDMIVETVGALEQHQDMLRDLQETYQYILADEHQDVNGSQNKILELLCNFDDQPNIFVVGDEKQAIYRFQGASLENFLYFESLFPNTKRISLTDNYRSGQTILDAAHSLVAVEEGPLAALRVPLIAKAVAASTVEQREFTHQGVEDTWVVDTITSAIDAGTSPEEIAIIVRTNREVEQYAALLRKAGISVAASADGDILDHPITHAIQHLIGSIIESHNEHSLFTLLHGSYWGISTNDLITVTSARSYGTTLWSIVSDREVLQKLTVEAPESILKVAAVLETARTMLVVEPPQRVLEFALLESGFIDHVLATDVLEGTRVIRRLYDEVERMVLYDKQMTLRAVRDILAQYREHRVALNAPYIASSNTAVQVMTAHKSKGLEFGVVFVPHAADSVWGGGTKRSLFAIPQVTHQSDTTEVIDDEERLLYVAMTRAKQALYLSYSRQNSEGKELIASRLFDAIDPAYITAADTAVAEAAFMPLSIMTQSTKKAPLDPALFRSFLEQRGLSVTALNNYLHSPYDYLYRNILRIPEVQSLPLQFGTAVHGVMEWVSATTVSSGSFPTPTAIKTQLETELSRLPLTQEEFVRLHEKGLAALLSYTEYTKPNWPADSKVEQSIRVVLPTGLADFPEVTLNGTLDRIDLDNTGKAVRVVDYKTGKPKTRNHIEGKTKSSPGDYKRQLVFYALLLSLYEDDRYLTKTGTLSFIEPDAKGVIHEETFTITDEEIEILKHEIISMVEAVTTGAFLTTACDDQSSSYCHLARFL